MGGVKGEREDGHGDELVWDAVDDEVILRLLAFVLHDSLSLLGLRFSADFLMLMFGSLGVGSDRFLVPSFLRS